MPALSRALEHSGDRKFRQDANEVQGELGNRSAVPVLIQALERWGDQGVPGVLLDLGGREAEDAVIRQVNRSSPDSFAWSAAMLLGARGITRAMPALRQAVEEACPIHVVASAAQALDRLGDPSTGPALVEWLSQENQDRRRRAASALAYLGRKCQRPNGGSSAGP